MAGNDHIPTAPKDVIGDDGDLREMRDALRAGKRVTLAHDGHVYVGTEAGTPMSDADESWIESKLGHVIEMARQGYGVSVSPDGSISADRADHLAKARYDNDPGFNEQDIILIKTGIQDGALVRLHTDGHIEYFLPKDAVKPSAADAARLQTFIDEEISSGRLEQAWKNGETLAAKPDGSVVYQRVGEGPAPVEFPEDGGPVREVPDTADELEAEALGLELGAGAARILTNEEYETAALDAVKQRDAAARARATAEGAATAADAQLAEHQRVVQRIANERADVAKSAENYRNAGDAARAEEQSEKLARLDIEHRIAQQEVADARAAAETSRAAVTKHAQDEAKFEGQVKDSWATRTRNEFAQDNQEDQARVYRQAAIEMREAERLDEAYADLQSRGVAGAERVKEAADQARERAEGLRTKAEEFDKQPEPVTAPADAPTTPFRPNPGPFGDLSDAGESGQPDPLGTATAVAANDGSDVEIEMPPIDFSGDALASAGTDGSPGGSGEFETHPELATVSEFATESELDPPAAPDPWAAFDASAVGSSIEEPADFAGSFSESEPTADSFDEPSFDPLEG
jgi:hypothetical protein